MKVLGTHCGWEAGDGVGVVEVVVEDEWHASINISSYGKFLEIGKRSGTSVTLEPPIRAQLLIHAVHLCSYKNHIRVENVYRYSMSHNCVSGHFICRDILDTTLFSCYFYCLIYIEEYTHS